MKIGTILRPNIEADDLNRIIKDDYETDSQDKMPEEILRIEDKEKRLEKIKEFESQPIKTYDSITKDKLIEALFTLADTWCPSIDEQEYIEFFN